MDYIKSGKRDSIIIEIEIIFRQFIQSCKLINQTFGKTIIVGVGKSGHIAEKCDTFVFGFIHKNTIL